MRKAVYIYLMLFMVSMSLWSVDIDVQSMAADGDWQLVSGRLVQRDVAAGKTKFAIPVPQDGNIVYEFNVKYERGVLEDGHGGFGIHVFADSVLDGPAWGVGRSWLLWLNYDMSPDQVIPGLSAQIYRSNSHSEMELFAEYDLNFVIDYFVQAGITAREALADPVSVKITVDGNSGEVRVYDPLSDGEYYYVLTLPLERPITGNFVALRTNGVSISFGQ